jgi:hypothetical protein
VSQEGSPDRGAHWPGPELAGPVPFKARRPGSVRRTSTIDSAHPEGLDGPTVIVGRARDLLTDETGGTRVLDSVELRGQMTKRSLRITSLSSVPEWDLVAGLVGSIVVSGFRKELRQWPAEALGRRRLLFSLLDDLPGASLVSGYGVARASPVTDPFNRAMFEARLNVCSGWATGGSMDQLSIEQENIPMPDGVELLLDDDEPNDPLAWHPTGPLGPVEMRRQRMIDVYRVHEDGSETVHADAHFRDVCQATESKAVVVHEYSVSVVVDPNSTEVLALSATAHVLPWAECPGALASAREAIGHPLADLHGKLGGALTGTSSCTHLNDTLRSLGHVDGLWVSAG